MNRHYWLLARTFFVVGSTSFGGYMALIAMIREKLVKEQSVIDDDRITEAIALASLLPGPVAVNVVAFVGFLLGGVPGATIAIVSVLLPSFLLILLLAYLYFQFQSVVDFQSVLSGLIPLVIGIILSVGVSMGRKNCIKPGQIAIAASSFTVLFLFKGYGIVVSTLAVAAMIGVLFMKPTGSDDREAARLSHISRRLLLTTGVGVFVVLVLLYFFRQSINAKLFTEFSAISLTLFGGGYVMIPIMKNLIVDQLQWLSYSDFMFGISVGQVTPGPILISAAFFGYKINGVIGAAVATVGIFFPSSFLMVVASGFYLRLKKNPQVQAALGGIRPAVVGLIFYSCASLFMAHMEDHNAIVAAVLSLVAFVAVYKYGVNTALLVIFGALLSYLVNLWM